MKALLPQTNNIFIISRNYHVCWGDVYEEHLKSLLANFQNMILLTIILILYTTSLSSFTLHNCNFVPFDLHRPIPP